MSDAMLWLGRLLGMFGVLVCAGAFVVRIAGHYTLAGFEIGTLFLGGIAAMVSGCLCLLLRTTSRR
jgi:hypothetical protein